MRHKRALALMLALAVLAAALPLAAAADPWYAEAQAFIEERGIAADVPGGFRPTNLVTRAEVVYGFYALAGRPKPEAGSTFVDVGDAAWYVLAVCWGQNTGLVQGTGGRYFEPTRTVSRGELATMIQRWLAAHGWESMGGNLSAFRDGPDVPGWARAGMETCVSYQILRGSDEGLLNPKGSCTWAELAQILLRLDGLGDQGEEVPTGAVNREPVKADKYGNVRTDITEEQLTALGAAYGDILEVTVDGVPILLPYGPELWLVDAEQAMATLDGEGYLTLKVNMGSFWNSYGLTEASTVSAAVSTKEGCKAILEARRLTPVARDGATDGQYANFREVAVGSIPAGTLYRSSNPIGVIQGDRRFVADRLLDEAGVATVVNLSDCRFQYRGYPGFDDTRYAQRAIVSLNMGTDFLSDAYSEDMYNGLDFLTENPGPYLLHGDAGVVRTGFMVMVLEALMGGTAEELLADYMRSFEDYYGLAPGSAAWSTFRAGWAVPTLLRFTGVTSLEALGEMDLAQAARDYLTDVVGLSADQVTLLEAHLSGRW